MKGRWVFHGSVPSSSIPIRSHHLHHPHARAPCLDHPLLVVAVVHLQSHRLPRPVFYLALEAAVGLRQAPHPAEVGPNTTHMVAVVAVAVVASRMGSASEVREPHIGVVVLVVAGVVAGFVAVVCRIAAHSLGFGSSGIKEIYKYLLHSFQ